MAKANKNDKGDAGDGGDLLAQIDERLNAFGSDLLKKVQDKLDEEREATTKKLRAIADHIEDLSEALDVMGVEPRRDEDDDDDEDELPEVTAARRMLGRNCPPDIAEIAKALRKRGHRLRLDGLRYASARDKVARNGREVAGPVKRGTGAVRMRGEATKVFDHNGQLVAQGRSK